MDLASAPPSAGHSRTTTRSNHDPASADIRTSILKADPQSKLFPLLPFGINYHRLVQEQQDHDPYYEYFSDHDQEQEVAQRCDVWEEFEEANKVFEDPTVFGLLREWQDERLAKSTTKDEDSTLRPTWNSVYGLADEVTEYGDPSYLHLRDWPRAPNVGDDKLRRLLSSSVRGRKRIPFNSDRAATTRIHARKKRARPHMTTRTSSLGEQHDEGNELDSVASGSEPTSTHEPLSAVASPSELVGAEATASLRRQDPQSTSITHIDSTDTSMSSVSATTSPSVLDPHLTFHSENTARITSVAGTNSHTIRPKTRQEVEDLVRARHELEDQQLVREMDEERAEEESHFVRSGFEEKFQTLSLLLDESNLKTISDEYRFEVPLPLRPPLNYLEPQPSPFSLPYKPIMDTEIVVSVAIYSALRPSDRTEEFLFLGSQPLTAMRDAFNCLSDFTTRGGDEPSADVRTRNTVNRKISSSYIFIEGVFYNDSPLLRAKIDKRNELREKELKRHATLVEAINVRHMAARKRRLDIRHGKRVATSAEILETLPHANQRGELSEDMEVDVEDSDLRELMDSCTYRDMPIEEIPLENEQEYARASSDYSQ
ncbi:hypothetical protein EDD11_001109 [Mortierella claussenii]|nr:hypothetical protein EDD11_001109 [Mortierella claussenii]